MNVLIVVGCLACPIAAVILQRRQLRGDVLREAEKVLHADSDDVG